MSIVSVGTTTNSGNSGTASVLLPASLQNDDYLEILLHINGPQTSSDGNGAAPFTEVLVDRSYNGPSAQIDHYRRFVTGDEAGTLFFPLNSSNRWSIVCMADRGVDTTTPYDVAPTSSSEGTGSGGTSTTNELVTVTDGALMKSYSLNDSNTVTFNSLPAGWGTVANLSGQQLMAVTSLEKATAGTQSAISYVQSASNGVWLNNIYALRPAVSGTAYTDDLVDSEGLTDTLARTVTYTRSVVDSIGLTDGNAYQLSISISLGDSIGVTDTISRQASVLRNIVDNQGITDILNATNSYNRSVVDNEGITDTLSYLLTININIVDSVGITDTNGRQVSNIRGVVDSVGVADSVARTVAYILGLSDVEGLTDVVSRQLSVIRGLVDGMGVQDANSESSSEAESLTNVQTYIGAYYFGLYAPTAGAVVTTEFELSDTLSISDLITVVVGTSYGFNPDTSLDQIVELKLSISAIHGESGHVEIIYEDKMKLNSKDILRDGNLDSIEELKLSLEQV